MSTSVMDRSEATKIARTIRTQAGVYALLRLGASNLGVTVTQAGNAGLVFVARMALKDEVRPRKMSVLIEYLSGSDLYDIQVSYLDPKSREIVHAREIAGVYAEDLARTLIDIESEGA